MREDEATPSSRPRARGSARQRILDAAAQRLLDHGPAGLVLEAVASDAGVSKGGLLYHFRSKEELVTGLTEAMLDNVDHALEHFIRADGGEPGAAARAYLATTVHPDGEPADSSGRLMAGILATIGSDAAQLDLVRERFAAWHRRLQGDGIDPTTATLVRLAADGLWLSALLGLPRLDPDLHVRVYAALQDLTHLSAAGDENAA